MIDFMASLRFLKRPSATHPSISSRVFCGRRSCTWAKYATVNSTVYIPLKRFLKTIQISFLGNIIIIVFQTETYLNCSATVITSTQKRGVKATGPQIDERCCNSLLFTGSKNKCGRTEPSDRPRLTHLPTKETASRRTQSSWRRRSLLDKSPKLLLRKKPPG